jgi:hypothetical protein
MVFCISDTHDRLIVDIAYELLIVFLKFVDTQYKMLITIGDWQA